MPTVVPEDGKDPRVRVTVADGKVTGEVAWRRFPTRDAHGAVVVAALATLVVFAIPHSVWGPEIDWDHPATPPLLGP